MGWLRTTSRAIIHGPEELGGFNIPHLYAIQGTTKLMTIYKHMQANTEMGQLITLNINWLQLTVGWETQIFEDTRKITYVKTNWLIHLKEYINKCQIQIKSQKFWKPKMKREKDLMVMDEALKFTSNVVHLKYINAWRIYFNVLTLSDMCDGVGKQVLEPYRIFKHAESHTNIRTSKLNWPNQTRPNSTTFLIWLRFLKHAFKMQNN